MDRGRSSTSSSDVLKGYSLKQVEKKFGIPIRKMTYLIRKDVVEPIIHEGNILLPEEEINKFFSLPKEVQGNLHQSFLKTLGPGIITGASDDDPSGIGTYSTVGANYGLGLTWLSLYLLPMNTAVQETVARIGIVTGKGLAGVMQRHYSKKILYVLIALLVIANTINIGADIGAMVASFQLLVPAVGFYSGAIVLTLLMIWLEVTVPYHKYAKILKWLTVSLFGYVITGLFFVHIDWFSVAKSMVIPKVVLDASFLAALVAVMGTTISPYLFFWQASEEVEEERDKGVLSDHHKLAYKREIKEMRVDTFTGMSYANIIFLFIVVVTASVFFSKGIQIESAADAAKALEPFAGHAASFLFTIGIFGVGLLSVPVLAGSSAYAVSEIAGWREGLSKRFMKARGFYGVIIASMIIGLAMNFLGVNPIKALYYAAIVNGITSPILMFFIFKIGRDKKVMGDFTSPRWVNFWGYIATVMMGVTAVALIVFSFLGK